MANTIITPQIIAKEALMQLENNLILGRLCHTAYKKEFVKVGNTVSIKKPLKFTAQSGSTRVNQDQTDQTTDIVINKQYHVSWEFSSEELSLDVKEYSKTHIQPAMSTLANQVEKDIASLYKAIPNYVGVAGTTPAAITTIFDAAKLLDMEAAPDDGDRYLVLDPNAKYSMANVLAGKYSEQMVEKAIRKGLLGSISNCMVYGSQNVQYHTAGVGGSDTAGTPLTDGASQEGATLTTDGWAASDALVAGDRFTIADTYMVNPLTRQSTGQLRRFVLTAAKTCSGTTNDDDLTIYPSILSSGAYQTISAALADGKAIQTIDGTPDAGVEANHVANLMFHKNAFALCMVPMVMPEGCSFKARETYNNYSVRVLKDYDINSDKEIIRLDILYGVKAIYPELACVIMG